MKSPEAGISNMLIFNWINIYRGYIVSATSGKIQTGKRHVKNE